MKISKVIAGIMMGVTLTVGIPTIASAEYITAYKCNEEYIVDTTSIYEKDKDHFNVIVYYYKDGEKNSANTYKYEYVDNQWKLWEKIGDKLELAVVENNSVAQDILRTCQLYLKKNK